MPRRLGPLKLQTILQACALMADGSVPVDQKPQAIQPEEVYPVPTGENQTGDQKSSAGRALPSPRRLAASVATNGFRRPT